MTTLREIEKYLETYDLQEVFEMNGLDDADILYFLVEQKFVALPNPKPVDLEEE